MPRPSPKNEDAWSEVDARAARGDLAGALECLLAAYESAPYYRSALQIQRWLAQHPDLGNGYVAHRRVNVGLAGSFTLAPLAAFLEVECLKSGLWPSIYVGGFNQFQSEILAADSPLFRFSPEVIFLAVTLEALLSGFDPFGATPRSRIEEAVTALTGLARTVAERCQALLVVHNFAPHPWAGDTPPADSSQLGPRRFVRELNLRLADAFAGDARTLVLDFEALVARYGARAAVDPKMRYLAGLELGEELLPVVARSYAGYLKMLKGVARKCIVLDLDGTLWGGIVGEDGIDGIHLGEDSRGRMYWDFQRYLLSLWNRGVLLAVNSKNNSEDALGVIRSHPGMVLGERHFASLQINWEDKAKNMLRIAEELNLGVESFVFVDDNPAERLSMRQQLPHVLTVELPADPSRYVEALASLNDFEVLALTEEDRRRGALYAEERTRRELQTRVGSFEDYLRALNMTITVRAPREGELARAAQLAQKTNQFNMTTRRYTAAQLQQRYPTFVLRITDAFGDHGLVGVAVVEILGDTWHLDSLLMSCRVLGRRVEHLFMERIAAKAQAAGAKRLTGEYIPTSKNQMAADFYPACGFRVSDAGEASRASRYELNLEGREFWVPDWITVVEETLDVPGPAQG